MKSLPAVRPIVLVALFSGTAVLADARIPIFEQTVITEPGHYVVTRDITVPSGRVIQINVDGVTVDLNGHTLKVQDTNMSVIAMVATAGVTQGVTIRGGRLVGALRGVRGNLANRRHVRLERLQIEGSSAQGIRIDAAASVEIVDCSIHGAIGTGILIDGDGTPFRGKLVRNVIQNAGSYGIHVTDMIGGEILYNSIVDYGTAGSQRSGIRLMTTGSTGGNLLMGNRVRGSDDDWGITVESGVTSNQLIGNVITGTGGRGIALTSDDNRVVGNQISGCGDDGVIVGGSRNMIEDNQIVENDDYGLRFNPSGALDNVYRGNMLRGNLSGEVSGTATDAGGNILD